MKHLTIVETLSTRARRVFIASLLVTVVVAISLGVVARARHVGRGSVGECATNHDG